MLTRAYDAIMAALQVPMIANQNVDFNNASIDDSVLNCKDYSGNIRCIAPPSRYSGNNVTDYSMNGRYIPFNSWSMQNGDFSALLPDEDGSDLSYEDYSVPNGTPSGWTLSSSSYLFSKEYDSNTKEFVCNVTVLWQNTSGTAKTVYGVSVRSVFFYRRSFDSGLSPSYWAYFLVCREHFASPVVVEDQGIISLTFTWRVGRAGLVSATASAAE